MPNAARWGYNRQHILIPFAIATGTSAEEPVTDWLLGYRGVIEKVDVIASIVAGAGAAASRDISLVKTVGSTDSTVASKTLVLADVSTKGAVATLTLGALAARTFLNDDDKLSIMIANGGTQFTAFTGVMLVRMRSFPQALGQN